MRGVPSYARIFSIFTLISVGVSFVLFLFFGSVNPRATSFEVANNSQKEKVVPSTLKKLGGELSQVLGISGLFNGKPAESSNESSLTNRFAGQIVNKLIERNTKGAELRDGELSLVLPGNFINLEDLNLVEELSNLRSQTKSQDVYEERLNIKEITAQDELTNYILLINNTYAKLFTESGFRAELKTRADAVKNYEILGHVFRQYAETLYDMPVPAVFKEFHKKLISAAETQRNIAYKFSEHQDDTLKAILIMELQKDLNNQYRSLAAEEITLINKYKLPVKINTQGLGL